MDNTKLVKTKSKKRMLFFALVLLCFVIGASYAVWNYEFTGEDNKITATEVSIDFLEDNDVISITNALPKSDSDGINQPETFDFAVTTKTTRNMDIGYALSIEKLTPDEGYTSLSDSDIKVYLTDENDNKLIDPVNPNSLENYVFYTDINSHNSDKETIQDKFKIRVWIDTNADFFSWDENTRLQYKFRINASSLEENNVPRYTVVYNSNTGAGSMSNDQFAVGATNKLKQNVFTKEGYMFKGWSTTANGEVAYQDKEVVKNLRTDNQTITLYAVWEEIISYQVRYNGNGGVVPEVTDMPNSNHTNETISTLSKNTYQKEHYNFIGWSTTANGEVEYTDEQVLNESLTSTDNDIVDLYAVWEPVRYKVTVVAQNGIVTNNAEQNIDYNTDGTFIVNPNDPTAIATATCTNNQTSSLTDTSLTVQNVSSDTICTVTFATEFTILYEDGTLIINELTANRQANIAEHGQVTNTYNAMSESDSYVFSSSGSMPWYEQRDSITRVEIGKEITPTDTKYWFSNLLNMSSADFTNLNTLQVTAMSFMFNFAGENVSAFNLVGLNTWDVSQVTDMEHIFYRAGNNATTWDIGDLSNWETSQVKDMSGMFDSAGYNATTWDIGDLSNWETSQVKDMSGMFSYAGHNAITWDIGDLSNWDTSQVTIMYYMFSYAGYNATTWDIGNLSNWDTSQVTNMRSMFSYAGYRDDIWNINLSNWDTSQVTDMDSMFSFAGYNATTWNIGDLSLWNTSQVTYMTDMFFNAGYNVDTFNIGDLFNWDTSQVRDMSRMFSYAGHNAIGFYSIGTLNIPSGCNVDSFASYSPYFNGTLILIGVPSYYDLEMFDNFDDMSDTKWINLYYTDSDSQTVVEEIIDLYGGNIFNMGLYTPPTP